MTLNHSLTVRICVLVAASIAACSSTFAQSVQHLSRPFAGGMPGRPVVTGVTRATNQVTVTWDGPSGYYQLFTQLPPSTLWKAVGGPTNYTRCATVKITNENAFFKVAGPAPKYVGSRACVECHRSTHTHFNTSAHAGAFVSPGFVASGAQTNPSCLPCHTVGFGLPSGFTSAATTPQLAGVQCESCHGPGAVHAANSDDPIYRPRVEIAATLCGGCHNDAHHPTFDEWQTSAHAVVTEDMNATNRISSCGRCHSGTVRNALIKGERLPAGDANMGITCVNCHDAHGQTGNPAQLLNPITSTKNFSLSTSAVFSEVYDPEVSVCGQCHNDRGASWTSSSRPPHHSPQYNMMLGTVGEMPGGRPARSSFSHADMIEGQCVGCHMQKAPFTSETDPARMGHTFNVTSFEMCTDCHPYPEILADLVQGEFTAMVNATKRNLDSWALTKAPAALRTKYGVRAWEYTTPGALSTGGSGPTTAEQAQIPDNIKKARFNLYLVLNDGSLGIHNPTHTARLLDAAEDWIAVEMNK